MLNKVLKDIVVKSRTMLGSNAVYVPGFDCHGLPIEHEVDKELGLDRPGVDVRQAMSPIEKIRRCREYALKFVEIQREEFKRLGVFGDWDDPYMTMAPAYEAVIAREFGRLVGRGYPSLPVISSYLSSSSFGGFRGRLALRVDLAGKSKIRRKRAKDF